MKTSKSVSKHIKGSQRALYLMMVPGFLYLLINNYAPMAGLFIAFKNINYTKGIFGSDWAGVRNFRFLFRTGDAWLITQNTLFYNGCFIVLSILVGVTLSICLNEIISKRLKMFYQSVILMPQIISMVVVSYLVYAFLASDTGFINKTILRPLGIEPVNWYYEKTPWRFILIYVHTWKVMGYDTLLYLASIVGIDGNLYEAAEIDGASAWKRIWYITLPLLKPTMITLSLLHIGRIFYSDFGLFYQVPMNVGALFPVTQTIDTYVYRGLTSMNNIGMAAAASFYQSIVGLVLVLTANTIVRKIDPDNALM